MKRLALGTLVAGLTLLAVTSARADRAKCSKCRRGRSHECWVVRPDGCDSMTPSSCGNSQECWAIRQAKGARDWGVRQAKGARKRIRREANEFCDTFREAHYWPEPYVTQARQSAIAPFEDQTANAWKTMNTLGSHYFDPGTHQLNEVGRLHVKWILYQIPERRRSIFIHQMDDPEVTRGRIAAVQSYMQRLSGSADAVPVAVTHKAPRLSPGIDVDVSNRLYYSSFPLPRLPGTETEQSNAVAPAGLPGGGS